jgi:predicted tellurium resistance membrane protein TerC
MDAMFALTTLADAVPAGGPKGDAPLFSVQSAIALVTLAAMEIVLGIDNIVFITILCGRLPDDRRARVRTTGLILALVMRIGLLFAITWVMGLTKPLFTILEQGFTGKDLILLGGGLFLIGKATYEIHHKTEGPQEPTIAKSASRLILVQIMVLDLVFSLDSVITAVGMVSHIEIMIAAVLISIGVMIAFAGAVGRFVDNHPAIKMLALAFLVLIGVMLTADGLGQHIPKGYIYFAMAFSLGVEALNIRSGTRAKKKQAALETAGD